MTGLPVGPPPCDQVCWEWVRVRPDVRVHSWTYTLPADHCGHEFDGVARVWRWPDRPPSNPHQETSP